MFNPFRKSEKGPVTPKQVFEFTPEERQKFEETGEAMFSFRDAAPKVGFEFDVFDGDKKIGKAKVLEVLSSREGYTTLDFHSVRCQRIEG